MMQVPCSTTSGCSLERSEAQARVALDFVFELLKNSTAQSFEPVDVLTRLAAAFGATGAGLAGFREGAAAVRQRVGTGGSWPWEQDAELLVRAQTNPTAVTHKGSDCSFLIAASSPRDGTDWLLWLEAPASCSWTAGDSAALALAATTMSRFLAAEAGAGRVARWLEQTRVQQRLEDAALIVGRLAHDFNNILTGIMGFTELSLGQVPHDTALHQYLGEVYQAAQKGANLTGQLKLFSQRSPSRSYPTMLGAVAADEAAKRKTGWGDKLRLEVDIGDALPLVALDMEPLQEVVSRLLDNARDALKGEGVVRLSARQVELTEADCLELLGSAEAGPHVEITVTDDGPGFSADARRRVFAEPFYSSKPRHRGLGMPIVYGVMSSNRGGVRLEHGAERGTTVRVYLPVAAKMVLRTPPSATGRGTSPVAPAKGERVLIVDDDPLILQLMCTTLEKAGYQVRAASDGIQALATYSTATEPFQLVLSDVVMPRMNGFDLVRRLLDRDPGVKVLFTSGHIPPGLAQQEGFAGRHFELLPKPFRPENLLRAVRGALQQPGRKETKAPTLTARETTS